MPTYGLGNYIYDITVDNGSANFKFWDSEDSTNTAEVSVSSKDFPAGITQADSRQVADLAYSQCSKLLNDKRDTRLKKQAADALEAKTAEEARVREEAADFLNNSQDVQTEPTSVTDDGTKVFNASTPSDSGKSSSDGNSGNGKK